MLASSSLFFISYSPDVMAPASRSIVSCMILSATDPSPPPAPPPPPTIDMCTDPGAMIPRRTRLRGAAHEILLRLLHERARLVHVADEHAQLRGALVLGSGDEVAAGERCDTDVE